MSVFFDMKSVKSDNQDELSDSQDDISLLSAFSGRLIELLGKNKLSQIALSSRSGVAKSKISEYCTGKRLPAVESAIAIADALDVTVPFLIYGREERAPGTMFEVPVLDIRLAAGAGAIGDEDAVLGHMVLDEELLRQVGRSSTDGLVVMHGEGDSMEPLIRDGAPILIDTRDTRVKEGFIYAFRVGDDRRIKRLRPVGLGDIEVSSVNPAYGPEVLQGEIRNHIEIFGRALLSWTKL